MGASLASVNRALYSGEAHTLWCMRQCMHPKLSMLRTAPGPMFMTNMLYNQSVPTVPWLLFAFDVCGWGYVCKHTHTRRHTHAARTQRHACTRTSEQWQICKCESHTYTQRAYKHKNGDVFLLSDALDQTTPPDTPDELLMHLEGLVQSGEVWPSMITSHLLNLAIGPPLPALAIQPPAADKAAL